MERKLALEEAKEEREKEKKLKVERRKLELAKKAERKKLELAKKWTKLDKKHFKEALCTLGFPDNVATVMQSTEVEGVVTTDNTETTEQKETFADRCKKNNETSDDDTFFPFQENTIDAFMQYASLENKDRSSVIDRLNKFEAFIFSVGKSPKKKKKVVAPESSTTSTTAASDDFEPTEKTLLTPKIKKRI